MMLENDVLETLKNETASFKFIINLSDVENNGCKGSCSGSCDGTCTGSCSGSCTSCAGRCVGYLD